MFGSIRRQIARLKAQLLDAKTRAIATGSSLEVWELEKQQREIYAREEIVYRQRSRVDWLCAGDQNTQYFENRVSYRKRKNTVKALKREDGSICRVDEEMRNMAANFYENLITSYGSHGANVLLQNIENLVTTEMNESLMAPMSDGEI